MTKKKGAGLFLVLLQSTQLLSDETMQDRLYGRAALITVLASVKLFDCPDNALVNS